MNADAAYQSALQKLTQSNFERHQREIHSRTDRMFAWVMAIQYILAVVFALVVSPRTWSGASGQTHPHVWVALFLGGALAFYPIFLALRYPGATYTRYVIAISQALFSALLIHLTGGRIETHFHVFGSLAFLAMYRDWRVLIAASVVVASDHFVRGAWFPFSVYGMNSGVEWRFLEHAGWVVFEDTFLLVACATAVREMRSMAGRQAELELAKERIEHAAAEVSRQSAVLNSVLTGMNDGLIVLAQDGRILHFNPAAETILGMSAEGSSLDGWTNEQEPYREDGRTPYQAEELPLARAMRGETIEREELRVSRGSTGEKVWLESSAQPLIDGDGTCIGGVTVFRDVTERKLVLDEYARARREAEHANRAKSEFLSRMSHELRTPMNSILGFGQLLKLEDLSADQEESLDQILKAGSHLLKLIDEVLDISGIEAGKLSISREPVDVPELVREVASLVQPLAQASNVTLQVIDTPPGEGYALADQQRLRQVILNLVSNAIKYNVDGGEVRLSTEREEGRLRLLVSDTGIGIPAEKRALLFNPFERIGAQHTEVQGTGLGLALSKRLTEAMGGEIGLRDGAVGSCFFVEFPVAQCPLYALENSDWNEEGDGATSSGTQATILLIEDNPANVRLIEKILRARPEYRLVVANQGGAGLRLALTHRPELILLDMDLPDLNGAEVLRRIRADRSLETTPVIVVSADATPSHIERLLEAGASAYLTKPIQVKTFLAHLDDRCRVPEKHVA